MLQSAVMFHVVSYVAPDGKKETNIKTEVMPSKKGALAGAIAGAALGSAIPIVGTTIGAVAGGVTGFILGPED